MFWYLIIYLLGVVVVYLPLERELLDVEGALYRYPGNKKLLCSGVSILWPFALIGAVLVVVYYVVMTLWSTWK